MARGGFILIFLIASFKSEFSAAFRFWTISIFGSAVGLLLVYSDPNYPYFSSTKGGLIYTILGFSISCVWAGSRIFFGPEVNSVRFVVMGLSPGLVYAGARTLGSEPDIAIMLTMALVLYSTAVTAHTFFVRTPQRYLPSQLLVGSALAIYSTAIFSSIILIAIRLWIIEANAGLPSDVFTAIFIDQIMSVLTYVGLIAMSLEHAQMRMKVIATIDPLTGLANRRGVHDQALHVSDARHRARHPMSLLIADIDHFKAVNDRYGHDCGDAVLKEFARRLDAHSRQGQDIVGRWGGEEFLVILNNTALKDAVNFAERLRLLVSEEPFLFGDVVVSVSVSIGVAEIDSNDFLFEQAVKVADEALYVAKRGGRNRVVSAAKSIGLDEKGLNEVYLQKATG